jgi:hypothetical protein
MAISAITGLMTAGTVRRSHSGLQTVAIPISERVHVALGWIAPEMAIGTEVQVDVTRPAGVLVNPGGFGVNPGVVTFVVGRSDGIAIRMTHFTGQRCGAHLYMTGVADRLQGFVVEGLYRIKLFWIANPVGGKRVASHADITA